MSMSSRAAQYEWRHPVNFAVLLFGACAAPIFWIGQLTLNYAVSAHACYPGDHPEAIASSGALQATMYAFDVIAILVAAAGGITAWLNFMKTGAPRANAERSTAEGRAHFLAVWGLFSSLWFLAAILFNTIASLTVPPCLS